MDLDEISNTTFDERQAHYKSQWVNDCSSVEDKIWAAKHAHEVASAEMLDEIHVMLRELLKRSSS